MQSQGRLFHYAHSNMAVCSGGKQAADLCQTQKVTAGQDPPLKGLFCYYNVVQWGSDSS